MLLIVVPVVWVAFVLVALTMLHTVALSDEAHDAALASWLTAAGSGQAGADRLPDAAERPLDSKRPGPYRATG